MRPPSVQDLLQAWERGFAGPPVERALSLLAASCPETPLEDLARESVGRRDGRLLTLREWMFGPRLVSLASCPACGENLETVFDVAQIRVSGAAAESPEPLSLSVAGCKLTFRLPNSLDLAALADAGRDVDEARGRLFARCIIGACDPDGVEIPLARLPETALQAVAARMAEVDPQGDVQIGLRCPACAHAWPAPFDIASYLWTEVDAWARNLLREVHALASAYGWWEGEILALGPTRRRAYLELIGG